MFPVVKPVLKILSIPFRRTYSIVQIDHVNEFRIRLLKHSQHKGHNIDLKQHILCNQLSPSLRSHKLSGEAFLLQEPSSTKAAIKLYQINKSQMVIF